MLDSLESQIRKLRSLFWSDRDQEGQAFVALAEAYRRNGDLDQAVDLLKEGLERHPEHTSGILVLGRVFRDRGDISEAREAFEKVVALDAENVEALRGLGEVAAAEGDMDRARDRFQKVLELDPDDSGAMTALRDLKTVLDQAAAHPAVSDGDGESEEEPAEAVLEAFEEPAELSVTQDSAEAVSTEDEVLVEWADEGWDALDAEPESVTDPEFEPVTEPDVVPGAEVVAEAGTSPDPSAEWGRVAADEPMESAVEEPVDEPEVYTRTMAEVYASQGHHSRAIEVLEHILEENPDDEATRARIEVLRDSLGTGDALASEPDDQEDEAVAEARLDELAEEMASRPEDEPIDTPFAWAADEPDGEPAGAEGPSAREYFARLLEWRPTPVAEPAASSEPAVVPVADLGPDTAEEGPFDHLPLVPIQDLAPDPAGTDSTDWPNP